MNKEQEELLGAAYKRYHTVMNSDEWIENWVEPGKKRDDARKNKGNNGYTKEEFINEIKTDDEFSEMWGLKIEERELSEEEGNEIRDIQYFKNNLHQALKGSDTKIDWENIPTKQITITYNNETIESYE
jgi:hypothetical protein